MVKGKVVKGNRVFTIIELITVIALLGVLSAIALPRFIDLGEEAEKAAANATMGAFETAVSLSRAKWIVSGKPSSIVESGVTIPMNSEGWPAPTTLNTANCIDLWGSVLQQAPKVEPFVAATPIDEWSVLGFANGCVFLYHNGDSFTGTQPLFAYYPVTISAAITAGSVLGFNMD